MPAASAALSPLISSNLSPRAFSHASSPCWTKRSARHSTSRSRPCAPSSRWIRRSSYQSQSDPLR
jgi:hypothetical protein